MQLYPEMQDIDRQSTKTSFLQLFPSIWHIAAKTTSNKLLAATRSVRYSFIAQRSVRYINFTVLETICL
jgi:hypothetical protein